MVHAHAHAHMRCAGACDHVHVLTGRRHSVTEGWYRIESRWVLVSIRESSRELHEMDAEAVPQRPGDRPAARAPRPAPAGPPDADLAGARKIQFL